MDKTVKKNCDELELSFNLTYCLEKNQQVSVYKVGKWANCQLLAYKIN